MKEELNDEEIMQHFTMEDEQTDAEQHEENDLVSEQSISHNTALIYAKGLLNCHDQQQESTLIEKLMLRNYLTHNSIYS